MRVFLYISRIIVGLVFIFSGFVKAIDPMGSAFKFTDYFVAFGMNSLQSIALPLAIILSTLEFILGIALLFNAHKKIASIVATIFMLIFTPLTLVLAISNPVTDCGCFGDALVLTNWQTFFKNLFLLIFVAFLFLNRRKQEQSYPVWQQNLLITSASVFVVSISVYSLSHLPIVDFRPYHIGANIGDSMVIPEGAPVDEYKSILIYEKNGEKKEFNETNYPWQDSTWKFVDSKQIKIKSGYTPPIHDFSITNNSQGDITNEVLTDNGYTFLFVSKEIAKINPKNIEKLQRLAFYAVEHNIRFIGLTATPLKEAESFITDNQLPFEFYNTDEVQLKTIIRSNPGLLLLRKGTILGKWHFRDFPNANNIKGDLSAYSITQQQQTENRLFYIAITALFALVISLFILLIRKNK